MSRFRPEGEGWARLDPKKLLIDPFRVVKEAAVPAAGGVIALVSSGNAVWLGAAVPVLLAALLVFAVLPWMSTYYRMTSERLEMHSGVLNKRKKSAPLDRVRSVDLTAGLLHRVVGLRKVEIGTGVDDERFELDALSTAAAEDLRARLMSARAARNAAAPAPAASPEVVDGTDGGTAPAPVTPAAPAEPAVELARFEWAWARYAPLSLTRMVVALAALGFVGQFADNLPILDKEHLSSAWAWISSFAIVLVVVVAFVAGGLLWVLAAVAEYVAKWWNLRLVSEGGHLNLTSGLFSTRSTSIEEKRVRGVEITQAPLLRMAGGAEITVMATGLSDNSPAVLPPCSVGTAREVGGRILGDDAPLAATLRQHGPRARRRAHVGALLNALDVVILAAILEFVQRQWPQWFEWAPEWLHLLPWGVAAVSVLLAPLLAEAKYANLGHALTEGHLVVGSGTFVRHREVLEHDGVIGWVVEQTFFQRRLGLCSLVATTAAGSESVRLHDVPLERAVELAHRTTPGVLDGFLVPVG